MPFKRLLKIPQSPRMTGAGLLEDGARLLTIGADPGPGLAITAYNGEWSRKVAGKSRRQHLESSTIGLQDS